MYFATVNKCDHQFTITHDISFAGIGYNIELIVKEPFLDQIMNLVKTRLPSMLLHPHLL